MAVRNAARPPVRERLLDAASELFYAEGVHSVGIDRVIEHAGVAKARLQHLRQQGSADQGLSDGPPRDYRRTNHFLTPRWRPGVVRPAAVT